MNINLNGAGIDDSCSGWKRVCPMETPHIIIVSLVSCMSVVLYLLYAQMQMHIFDLQKAGEHILPSFISVC